MEDDKGKLPEACALPVAVWLQKGDQFGWLMGYKRASSSPGHEDDLPTFYLTTNAVNSKIVKEFDEDAKEMLRWFFHHGWILRVCGSVDRRHWLGDEGVGLVV